MNELIVIYHKFNYFIEQKFIYNYVCLQLPIADLIKYAIQMHNYTMIVNL